MIHRLLFLSIVLGAFAVQAHAQVSPVAADATTVVHAADSMSDRAPVNPPGQLLGAVPDWEGFFSATTGESHAWIRPGEWPAHVVYGLMLSPGTVYVDGTGDDVLEVIEDFRRRHPAVVSGEHERLVNASYAFQRSLARPRGDRVVVVMGAEGRTAVNVSRVFSDDVILRDAMTGKTAFVSFGMATFDAHPSGLILIEESP